LDSIGVQHIMVIGEVGAGKGRFTLYLSERVGTYGHIYAKPSDKSLRGMR